MSNGRRVFITKGDIDGFFGLMLDNLIQLILIGTFLSYLIPIPKKILLGRIFPACGISILFGNLFYSYQARRLALRIGNLNATALPYGINTVSLFAFIFFIMLPIYRQTQDPLLAWKVGILACFWSGVIELSGAFLGTLIRKITPRASLLSALAGIAITFISMDFLLRTFENPLVSFLPLTLILMQYFSQKRLPLGIPAGFLAIIVGTIIAWILKFMNPHLLTTSMKEIGLHFPKFSINSLKNIFNFKFIFTYFSIIFPMGLFHAIGSLQNLESAESAGDKYSNFSSLAINGIGSILASLLGSCFPTTIYIGHPGWKKLGARWAYSTLNGIFIFLLTISGSAIIILNLIPLEAGMGILLWIGIVIITQAYQAIPKEHAPAVCLGLLPVLSSWGLNILQTTLEIAHTSIYKLGLMAFKGKIFLEGMISLERGFIFTSIIWASIGVYLIENKFRKASLWALSGSILSFFGIIHAYKITPEGITYNLGINSSPKFMVAYLLIAGLFLLFGLKDKNKGGKR